MTSLLKKTQWNMLAAVLALSCGVAHGAEQQWQSLFNGKDLSGWTTYVSMQPTSDNMPAPSAVRGVGVDPKNVFSVVDGMLRISGEEWGSVSTVGQYDKFHLKFEFKWGQQKWAPRENAKRDSGLLYYAVGPEGAQSGHWMRSFEFQIQEGDCGDFHSLDKVTVEGHVADIIEGEKIHFRYDPALPRKTGLNHRIIKAGDAEKPSGEWNTMEVIADGKTMIHIVNGREVLRVFNPRQIVDGKTVPLARGKFSLQSEGSEVFYRNILVKKLSKSAAHTVIATR